MKLGKEIGAIVENIKFRENVSFEELKNKIFFLNEDERTNGIIIQLPLPVSIDRLSLINLIIPDKDVDGLSRNTKFIPATARGIKQLLDFYKIRFKNKKIAVIGRSMLVGGPTAKLFEKAGAEVTVCHSQTPNTEEITKKSDIIIVAVGKAHLIDEMHIGKNLPVVVDVGLSLVSGKLVGDVNFEKVKNIVSAMTPAPGGVGPMTVLSLFENLVLATKKA